LSTLPAVAGSEQVLGMPRIEDTSGGFLFDRR
jgi:hypothetical protein